MTAPPMSPGTMLDGRYRLDVLLSEYGGARFWRATDTVLARSVAVHVVPSDDPRSTHVLEAARTSAAVTDPHFLRVLDCADADGLTWVINEWGEGVSLDVMLARGTLPAMRAAWLTREVAEAIVAAHAQGLCHGRLNPEAVIVTESGSVKLIGFVVNAAFERTPNATTVYGDISPRETDVVDLAGILYAALTGKWPGVSPSAVPAAPREGRKPLRPRQVRAGVPRDLDAICDRVLNKEASQHTLPIETALEIAAALSDFVGDPALVAPVDAPSMHDEPEPPKVPDSSPLDPPDIEPVEMPPATPVAPVAPPRPAARPAGSMPTDPEETMATAPPFSPSGMEFFEPEDWEPMTPLPPFEQPPERPLFADEVRREPATAPPPRPTPTAAPTPPPPVPPAPAPIEAPRKRRGLKALLLSLVAIAVAVAMYLAFTAGKDEDPSASATPTTAPTTAPPPTSTAKSTGAAVKIAAVADFDPEGDPQAENPGRAGRAIDGDASIFWPTAAYPDANFGSAVSGVGLIVDLGAEKSIASIEVQLIGQPNDVAFYASAPGAGAPPAELADATELGRATGAGTSAVIEAPTTTRYLIIWLTKLPADGAAFRGKIAEITVRS